MIGAELAAQSRVERPGLCGVRCGLGQPCQNPKYFYSSGVLGGSTCDSRLLTKTRFDEHETADATVPSTLLLEQFMQRRAALCQISLG